MTGYSANIREYELKPVTDEEYDVVVNRHGFSDTPRKRCKMCGGSGLLPIQGHPLSYTPNPRCGDCNGKGFA